MNIIQTAITQFKEVDNLPGEKVFLAVEDFINNAIVLGDNKQEVFNTYLSLEDGEVSRFNNGMRATLALESLTGGAIAIIVAIGVAIATIMYKLYKHFFGNKEGGSMRDNVSDFADNIEEGIPDVSGTIEATLDAKYTVQDAEAKKDMQAKIDQLTKEFEEKHNDNIRFAVIADNKNSKKFITYYKHLAEIVTKLDRDLLDLESQLDKGADMIKTVASLNSSDPNSHTNALLTKETQILNDKLDLYHIKAESLKLDEAVEALVTYRGQLEKNPVPGNFFSSLDKNDAKAFISSIMRQEAINMQELSKHLDETKAGMDTIIKTTKKYEGLDKVTADIPDNPAMKEYFAALRKGMLTARTHTKALLAVAKAEDLLYKSAKDCCTILIQHTADMANIVNSFAPQDNKIAIKEAKGKMASFFKKLTGKN